MHVIEVYDVPPASERELVLAIGKFDGVHIGHQAILDTAKRNIGHSALAVFSFAPHPMYILSGRDEYRRSLTPGSDKLRLLAQHGVDILYKVRFSRSYAKTSAEEFVLEHLKRLHLRRVVVGDDFRFGQGGMADVQDLQRLCDRIEVPVVVAAQIEENGVKVSSSQVRIHLSEGRVEAAEALLGRPYSISGIVIDGQKLGRTIGFPTANLGNIDEYVLPKVGVYAVSVEISEQSRDGLENWFGVANVGYRPTVHGEGIRIEAHLLGYEGDLYAKTLRISFLRRIRDEQKFAGVTELQEQIARDCEFARSVLGISHRVQRKPRLADS